MSDINTLLDACKSLNPNKSDRQTALALGIEAKTIYDWRAGRQKPTDQQILDLAEHCGQDANYWLAIMASVRAKSDILSYHWRDIAEKIAS